MWWTPRVDDADEHREAAEGRDDERLHRRAAVRRARRVVTDEQVGEDRRQLPEDVEHEEVVGEDEAEHRAGERREDRREAPQRRVAVGEVPRAVEQDERTDPGDEQAEHPRERRDAEVEIEPEPGDPRDPLGRKVARADVARDGDEPAERDGGGERQDGEGLGAQDLGQPRREGGGEQVQEQQLRHGGPSVVGCVELGPVRSVVDPILGAARTPPTTGPWRRAPRGRALRR